MRSRLRQHDLELDVSSGHPAIRACRLGGVHEAFGGSRIDFGQADAEFDGQGVAAVVAMAERNGGGDGDLAEIQAQLACLEIQRAAETLARHDIHLVWGPGRHIIGHNIAIYHRNADKVRVEFFCEMDQMKDEALGYFDPRPWHQDRPQRPKVWGPDTLRNYWGYGSERVIRGYQTIE